MKSYKTNNKCLMIADGKEGNKITLGYFNTENQIDKVLTLINRDEYVIDGWLNTSYDNKRKVDKIMFELTPEDKLSYYINQFLGKDKKYEISDGEKKVTFYRDDEYNIYIIFCSKNNSYDISEKFKIRVKGNYRLYSLFNNINDNLNVEDHQITIDEYLYERKLNK